MYILEREKGIIRYWEMLFENFHYYNFSNFRYSDNIEKIEARYELNISERGFQRTPNCLVEFLKLSSLWFIFVKNNYR